MSHRVMTPDIREDRNAFCRALQGAVSVGLDGALVGSQELVEALGLTQYTRAQEKAIHCSYLAAWMMRQGA